jgi:hypothetical protein
MLRRAIKAKRITCYCDSEGEYADPVKSKRGVQPYE